MSKFKGNYKGQSVSVSLHGERMYFSWIRDIDVTYFKPNLLRI